MFNGRGRKQVNGNYPDDAKPAAQLIEAYDEFLDVYTKYRLDGIPDSHERFDMHEETVLCRDSIHVLLEESDQRGIVIDTTKLKEIDTEWQKYINDNKTEDFKLVDLNREEAPKYLWWFWIDQLEELTPEERSTL